MVIQFGNVHCFVVFFFLQKKIGTLPTFNQSTNLYNLSVPEHGTTRRSFITTCDPHPHPFYSSIPVYSGQSAGLFFYCIQLGIIAFPNSSMKFLRKMRSASLFPRRMEVPFRSRKGEGFVESGEFHSQLSILHSQLSKPLPFPCGKGLPFCLLRGEICG